MNFASNYIVYFSCKTLLNILWRLLKPEYVPFFMFQGGTEKNLENILSVSYLKKNSRAG